jgi:ABC-type multidrug transport system fused ATPase/permease subunit
MIQSAVTTNISMFLRFLVQILGSIVVLFILSWKLSLLMFASIPFVSIGAVIYGKFLRRLQKTFQDELAVSGAVAEECESGDGVCFVQRVDTRSALRCSFQ